MGACTPHTIFIPLVLTAAASSANSAANLNAAAARIQDTDYALETAALTKAAILNQSAMAMVAQANDAQQSILTVIQ